MVKYIQTLLLVCLLVLVNSKAVPERMTNEIEARSSVSKNVVADLLNSVLVKSRRKKQNVQRVKRSNKWSGYILVSPYCIPGTIDCPCDACDYCCKGQCNSSGSAPCAC
ncbi:Hypothetical predicted protein [Paramuricea clavata]|uniref:Uncharacterized protein n=1 Tax=Paramuricea clavata TaxID=317549 RepID=A0A7D9I8I7_PARCT|nr:Hypothetical predicted protein [Paramuricea clavata]